MNTFCKGHPIQKSYFRVNGNGIKKAIDQEDKIAVFMPYDPAYIEKVKSIRGYRRDPKRKCWIFPRSEVIVKRLLEIFKDENVWIDPVLRGERTPFTDLRMEMVSQKYSPKTVKAYLHYNKDFLKFIGKQIGDVTEGDIKGYLFHLAEDKKVAASTINLSTKLDVLERIRNCQRF